MKTDLVQVHMARIQHHNGVFACFLHDVKVYYTACKFQNLEDQQILVKKTLYLKSYFDEEKLYDYDKTELKFNKFNTNDFKIDDEYIIDPLRIHDFSVQFNEWL